MMFSTRMSILHLAAFGNFKIYGYIYICFHRIYCVLSKKKRFTKLVLFLKLYYTNRQYPAEAKLRSKSKHDIKFKYKLNISLSGYFFTVFHSFKPFIDLCAHTSPNTAFSYSSPNPAL